jgi:hypothetical protein
MKLKSLLLGLTGFALLGTSAFAVTDNADELRIVGSTAFRAPVTAAIIAALGGSGNVSVAYYASGQGAGAAGSASGLFGASSAYFVNSSGQIVKTYWTGSLAGVVDCVAGAFSATGSSAVGFLPDGVISYNTAVNSISPTYTAPTTFDNNADSTAGQPTNGAFGVALTTFTANSGSFDTTPPNMAMSDSFASSVAASVGTASAANVGSYTSAANLASGISSALGSSLTVAGTAGEQTLDEVGIVPFEWVLGNTTNTPAGTISNITQSQACALINTPIPVMFLTGNTGDSASFAYLIGRNEDSGTRIGAFAEAQDYTPAVTSGAFGTTTASQWELNFTNAATTNALATGAGPGGTNLIVGGKVALVTGGFKFPANFPLNTEPSIYWSKSGHSGYTAGGDVANVLSATNSLSNGHSVLTSSPSENSGAPYFIGYLGLSDAYSITGGKVLQYNGVTPSIPAIQTGQYTFWTFEHAYYVSSGTYAVSSNGANVANTIADDIYNTYADTTKYGQTIPVPASGPAPAGVLISTGSGTYVTHGKSGIEGNYINFTY